MTGSRLEMGAMASGQYGLISSTQLRTLGFSDGQRRHLLDSGALRRVRPGVYMLIGVRPCWEQSVLAAVLAAGPGAVASHGTAAALWCLKHADQDGLDETIHLTCPRQLRLEGVTGHQRVLLEGTVRQSHRAIPVTTPEQTIMDLAGTINSVQLGECIDDAARRSLIRLDRLNDLVRAAAGPGRRRIIPIRQALADRAGPYDPAASALERKMDRIWFQLGLPASVAQYRVHVNGHAYRLDRAIPDLQIGIEWNGYAYHGTRSGFDHDSDRRADLTAAGWLILDFTSRSKPQRIFRAVTAAIAQRQHLRRAPAQVQVG